MVEPVNNHLIIEPIVHEGFIASQKETYDEIGVVIAVADDVPYTSAGESFKQPVSKGDKVFFDSWLAAKFPKEGGTDEFYWLVKWTDVRAVEHGTVPKQ